MRPVHASPPGLPGDHRTDGIHCGCDPDELIDMNEPARVVVVHHPFPRDPDDPRNPWADLARFLHPERLP